MNNHEADKQPVLHISGAGPAGLVAAITCAQAGAKVIVHERKQTVGSRFHGDFQGQENWSSSIDVIEELAEAGIRDDFHNEHVYLRNTVDFFQQKLGFSMGDKAKRFGGLGNISYPATARKGNILYVGEAAGFQDALWGFGMRYAMASGILAAEAWLQGKPEHYDRMWQQSLGSKMRAGIVNRFIFSRLGNRGYTRLLARLVESRDAREWLMQHHRIHWYTRLLFPWANRQFPSKRREFLCPHSGCSCTWCQCHKGCEGCHA